MRFVFALLIFALACAAQAGVINGGFDNGLDGWEASDGLADWWTADGVLAVHTRSKLTDPTWIINAGEFGPGVYDVAFRSANVLYPGIDAAYYLAIGDSFSEIVPVESTAWEDYCARIWTTGGHFRLGVWTRTDSTARFDDFAVTAVPETSALLILATGCVALFRKLRR